MNDYQTHNVVSFVVSFEVLFYFFFIPDMGAFRKRRLSCSVWWVSKTGIWRLFLNNFISSTSLNMALNGKIKCNKNSFKCWKHSENSLRSCGEFKFFRTFIMVISLPFIKLQRVITESINFNLFSTLIIYISYLTAFFLNFLTLCSQNLFSTKTLPKPHQFHHTFHQATKQD